MFYGADTDQMVALSHRAGDARQRLLELVDRLDPLVTGVDWQGPDADAFRSDWSSDVATHMRACAGQLHERVLVLQQEGEEQDCASGSGGDGSGGDGSGGGSPWDQFVRWLDDYEPRESDGFFGDLLGGPESGLLGTGAWNTLSLGLDVWGMFPGEVATAVGLPFDLASAGIGLYDASQSFQDGELYGTVDGLVSYGVNALDSAFGIVSLVPHPIAMAVGEGGGIVTGGIDSVWSAATVLAQMDAAQGGDHGGSTTRFLLESMGAPASLLDTAESLYGQGTGFVRDAVPILDPLLDAPQYVVENLVPGDVQETVESWAGDVNDWADDNIPWWH